MDVVFDASTLILLAKVDILRIVAENVKIIIPEEVKIECTKKDVFDAKLISALIEKRQIKVKKLLLSEGKTVSKLCKDFKIQYGEAAALHLAVEKKCPLAVDDGPTIKACKIINQKFTTAIHFLVNMTETAKIDRKEAIVKLEKLSCYGRYSRRIIEDASKRMKGEN